ncbi:hypothetical protein CRYUN_Cryun33cG0025500 [Craigia yunnanensis]
MLYSSRWSDMALAVQIKRLWKQGPTLTTRLIPFYWFCNKHQRWFQNIRFKHRKTLLRTTFPEFGMRILLCLSLDLVIGALLIYFWKRNGTAPYTHAKRWHWLIVVLQEKTYIYDSNSLAILDTVDTVPNLKGLCAFSPSLDGCFLALPASMTKGSVLVYNVMELQSHCEIDAHRSPLAAIALSSNGTYIATASEQGTIIRVHLVSEATKSYSFRRGTYPSTIFSSSFAPSLQLPDILAATSSSGSVHIFPLGFDTNQRSKNQVVFLDQSYLIL